MFFEEECYEVTRMLGAVKGHGELDYGKKALNSLNSKAIVVRDVPIRTRHLSYSTTIRIDSERMTRENDGRVLTKNEACRAEVENDKFSNTATDSYRNFQIFTPPQWLFHQQCSRHQNPT